MTRCSPRTVLHRAAGSLAAAGLLAAASLTGAAAPAQAAELPALVLGGPAETALYPYPESGAPPQSTVGFTVNNPGGDEEDDEYETEFTVTFDLSGIAGVADTEVKDTSDCTITGTKAVCKDYGIWAGLRGIDDLLLSAAEGSEMGDSGTITVTGQSKGATFTPFTTKVTIGGPDLIMEQLPFKEQTNPGDKQQAPITFTNRGTRAADGVLLNLVYSRGLDIPERYSNCEYTEDDPASRGIGWTTALCSVEGSFEVGETYTLATPLTIEATDRAYYDMFVYGIHEDSAAQRTAQRAGAPFERGSGSVLKAVPTKAKKSAPAARGGDLDPWDNQHEADFRTKNTADFVAYGDKVAGAEGSTVKAEIGFRNEGPAWIGYIRSDEAVATLDFTVPQGATVTAKPDLCRAVTADGGYLEDQKSPAPRYTCTTTAIVKDGGGLDLPFELRIDKGMVGAEGAVTVRSPWLQDPKLPFDPKPANNTAYLILNGEGDGSDSGGATAGGDGGSGEPSTPPTSAPDPAESSSGTSGPSASTTSGGGAAGTTGGSGGGLASTGSVALIASGTAAAALAAGLLLFTAARRRSGAQHI
ncbi:peptidase [Streptomyces sp. JUS-F4]|uniref:peptidase n=1 Tax=unclassified Streptomyces TaxID=2593676 RepID=UPI001C4E517A|nr:MULTISPECIES: peptidase [unclassified Streptomyces]QXQ98929.1 peptidase [Streptomyces sp. WY228]WKN16867.1 peptidase [Streptomyces sp. JUS-F4]